jgi:hypothetical protein
LENLTRWTDELRGKVDDLVVEQSKVDIPEEWKHTVNDANKKASPIDEGRRSYSFYHCGG